MSTETGQAATLRKWNNHQIMSEMETEEGPTDPTDPVEEMSPARSTTADPTWAKTEVMDTPPYSSEIAPVMTSSPVIASGDSVPDPV